MSSQKRQKAIFKQLSITEKTLLPTLLPPSLIILDGIVTIMFLSLTLMDYLHI